MKLLLLIRSSPYANLRAQEALDVALVASAFEQDISILYMDDGVYQLLNQQQGNALNQKHANAPISALHFYDIEKVFAAASSLEERGLEIEDLSESLGALAKSGALTDAQISELIAEQDQVLSF